MISSNHHTYHQVLIRNFKSFSDPFVFDFESGITVLKGKNGHGKSTICDGLFFGLYGSTLSKTRDQKVNIDKIVNSIAGGNLLSIVTFSINRNGEVTEYMKVIGRKPAVWVLLKLPNKIDLNDIKDQLPINGKLETFLEQYGEIVILDVDKSKSQLKFEKEYMQIDEDMFKSSRCATLAHLDFIYKNDKDRSSIILDLFDANWIDKWVDELKLKRKDLTTAVNDANTKLTEAKTLYDVARDEKYKAELDNSVYIGRRAGLTAVLSSASLNKGSSENFLEGIEKELIKHNNVIHNAAMRDQYISTKTMILDNINVRKEALVNTHNIQKSSLEESIILNNDRLAKNSVNIIDNIEEYELKKEDVSNKIKGLSATLLNIDMLNKQKVAVETQINTLNEKLMATNEKISNSDSILNAALKKDKDTIEEINKKLTEFKDKINVVGDIEEIKQHILTCSNTAATYTYEVDNNNKFIAFYNDDSHSTCSMCGNTITPEVRNEMLEKYNTLLNESNIKLTEITSQLDAYNEMSNNYRIYKGEIAALTHDIRIGTHNVDVITLNHNNDLTNMVEWVKHVTETIEGHQKQLIELQTSIDLVKDVDLVNLELAKLSEQEVQLVNVITSHNNAIENAKQIESTINDSKLKLANLTMGEDPEIAKMTATVIEMDKLITSMEVITEDELAKLSERVAEINDMIPRCKEEVAKQAAIVSETSGELSALPKIDMEEYCRICEEKSNIVDNYTEEYEKAYKAQKINENIINIFTNNSMRNLIFIKHIAIINQYIAEMIDKLNLPFTVKFNNDFSVDVKGYGYGDTLGTYSEGQKHIINIISFAVLKELLVAMDKYSSDLVIFDEYLDRGLDDTNTNNLLGLIRTIYTNEKIILITHKDFDGVQFDRTYLATMDIYSNLNKLN